MKKKTLPRFFVPDLDAAKGCATLPPDEAQHLTRVLRLRPGDELSIFDGRGREFVARVTAATRREVTVTLDEPVLPAQEFAVHLTLAQAMLKGEKIDHVVRDAVMLGAARIVPLVTARVVVSAAAIDARRLSERWTRVALASTKQSGRATLTQIEEPRSLDAFLGSCEVALKLFLVEPAVSDGPASLREFIETPPPSSVALIVGPEGGWSAQERELAAAAGCQVVTLGGLTLRADAVAVAAISIVRFLWDAR